MLRSQAARNPPARSRWRTDITHRTPLPPSPHVSGILLHSIPQIGNGVKYILNVDIQGVPAPLYMNVSKHQVIVFEEDGTLTDGLAIDEFPEIVDFYSDEFW